MFKSLSGPVAMEMYKLRHHGLCFEGVFYLYVGQLHFSFKCNQTFVLLVFQWRSDFIFPKLLNQGKKTRIFV